MSPPPTIASDCSVDVSHPMQHWLRSLAAGTTVSVPAGACYLVDEGLTLTGAQGLTISGGTWKDATSPAPGASPTQMSAVFWLVGGSGITLENLTIAGANPGGYVPAGAFAAGIRSDGVVGLTVGNVTVDDVYGDGVELAPLRGSGDTSNVIVNPSENVSLSNLSIDGAGRQGITLASVDGATIDSVRLGRVGLNVFDVEADQWGEGALHVTINGCTDSGGDGGLFFANAGLSDGAAYTGDITVENCTMLAPDAGDAVLVQAPQLVPHPRGPITFVNDALRCGASVYVACVMATDARVSINGSTLSVPGGTVHESIYRATEESALTFGGDTVNGYGQAGSADATSSVSISGGVWAPWGTPVGPVPVSPDAPQAAPGASNGGADAGMPASTANRTAAQTPGPSGGHPSTAGRAAGASVGATGAGGRAALASDAAPLAATAPGHTSGLMELTPVLALLGGLGAVVLGLSYLFARRRRSSASASTTRPSRPLSVEELLVGPVASAVRVPGTGASAYPGSVVRVPVPAL